MSLRARLLIVTVVLVASGLLVANLATYRYLSGFLLRRVDQQLATAVPDAGVAFAPPSGPGDHPPGLPGVAYGTYVAVLDGSGKTVVQRFLGPEGSPPNLPAQLPMWSPGDSAPITVRSLDGSTRYRVLANEVRFTQNGQPASGTIVVAIPLTELHVTLRHLMGVEFLVSAIVLLVVAGLALWLVRIGLQPLEGMGRTADAIAGGDLTRRVEPADDRTEVGRLGIALNTMLARIEAAFEQRRRSEERLRRFVADASHELRTPLTSIRGYAELFRRGADTRPEDLAKSMSNIESEASRMGVLVDDLLLLARLDQGRPLEREPLDLAAVASDAVESARAIEPDRTIELVADDPVRIVGDASRLRQVMDNLLDNARVHAPGSPVRVEVSVHGEEALLRIGDQGPGLDPEVEGRIFERFMRGDPSRSRGTGGVGLGLSIVQAIVAAHGGDVMASSGEGRGTVFEVRLPVGGPPDAPTRPDQLDAKNEEPGFGTAAVAPKGGATE
jgi:two-component system, OmpR family, sensor kinase